MRRRPQPQHHAARFFLGAAAVLFVLAGVIGLGSLLHTHAAEWGLTAPAATASTARHKKRAPLADKPAAKRWSDFSARRPFVYTALGDSLAAGYFATASSKGYVAQVAQQIKAQQHVPVTVHNFSENGGSINTVAFPQLTEIYNTQPDLVTIEFGTNESVYDDPPHSATPAKFEKNLRKLISDLRANTHARIVLLTTWNQPRSLTYDARIQAVAKADHLPVANLQPIWQQAQQNGALSVKGAASFLGYGDGFHPSDTGHTLIARAVYQQIKPLFTP